MKIARGARKQWIEGGELVFVVSASVGADRLLDTVRALERPLLAVGDEDDPGPKFMSDPAAGPGGVVFWLDAPDISETRLNEVLEVISAAVDMVAPDARLSAPTARLPYEGDELSATLYLVAAPGPSDVPVPPAWVPIALEWAAQGFPTVVAHAAGAVEVMVTDAPSLLQAWLGGGAYGATVATRQDGVARWAEFHRSHDGLPARLALAESGHHLEHTLNDVFDTLVALGRQRADDTVWAFADVALHGSWSRWLNISRQEDWLHVGDHILGVHPWQRLGPGHLARLGRALDEGEVRTGGLDDWLRRPFGGRSELAVEQALYKELGPCLLPSDGRSPRPDTRRRRALADDFVRRECAAVLETCGHDELARAVAALPDLRDAFDPIEVIATLAPAALERKPGLVAVYDYRPDAASERLLGRVWELALEPGSFRTNWDPWSHAQDFLHWDPSTPPQRLAEAAWWACAQDAGVGLFLDAWECAELTFPRRLRRWHEAQDAADTADGRKDAWDHVRNAAAEALMGTSDTAGLWAQMTVRIAVQLPVWWETFEREIRARFGEDVDTAFRSADEFLSNHVQERRVAAAVSAICGAALALTTNVIMTSPRLE